MSWIATAITVAIAGTILGGNFLFPFTSYLYKLLKNHGFSGTVHILKSYVGSYLTFKLAGYIITKNHDHYIINYPYGTSWYKIIIRKHPGPNMIENITTSVIEGKESEKEVIHELAPYLGPGHDFQGMKLSPNDLGYDSLKIYYFNGNTKIYATNEIMEI